MSKPKADKTSGAQARGAVAEYKPEYCNIARKLLARGMADLAGTFGVSERTIVEWKAEYGEFAQACESGQEQAAENIERALYDLASGYDRDVTKVV